MAIEAEAGPPVVEWPMFDLGTKDGAAAFLRWILEQHVALCSKGGIDCRTCERARTEGIASPA
jgi:hypothetical protein